MRVPTGRLTAADVLAVLELVDPLAIVAGSLTSRTASWAGERPVTLARDADGTEVAVVGGGGAAVSRVPADALRLVRVAALVALTARRLVPHAVITAAVLGAGFGVHALLVVLARHVTGISHVALHDADGTPPPPEVLDQLHLAGIGLSVAGDAGDAVLGANVVVVAGAAGDALDPKRLARGAVVVNADGRPRAALVAFADQVYVDDMALVALHPTRYAPEGPGRPARSRQWPRAVVADLVRLLSGDGGTSAGPDDTLLVDLLGADHVDPAVAEGVHEAAGRVRDDPATEAATEAGTAC